MTTYAEALTALPSFRNFVTELQFAQRYQVGFDEAAAVSYFHATGVGLRRTSEGYDLDENVLKLYVFREPEEPPTLREWYGVQVDVEELPIQSVWSPQHVGAPQSGPLANLPQRGRHRPLVGGISIAPAGVTYAGTAGCFLLRTREDGDEILALSARHVLVGTGRFRAGTAIVQPAEYEQGAPNPGEVIATLNDEIPLRFAPSANSATTTVTNQYDVAVGRVAASQRVESGVLCGGLSYTPGKVGVPVPGMRVIKSGRSTGITHGLVVAVGVGPLRVNYGSLTSPQLAFFEDTIEIVSTTGGPFSMPGDSGSVVLAEATGTPVALLFCGDTVKSSAFELGPVCRRFGALPI